MIVRQLNMVMDRAWIDNLIRPIWCEDTTGLVAIGKDWVPTGVILLDQWTKTSVQAHIGVLNSICLRRLLPEVFHYVFETAGREIMFGLTPSNNPRALRLSRHIGFKVCGRLQGAYDTGVDYVVFRMDRADCRFLHPPYQGLAHGKEVRTETA